MEDSHLVQPGELDHTLRWPHLARQHSYDKWQHKVLRYTTLNGMFLKPMLVMAQQPLIGLAASAIALREARLARSAEAVLPEVGALPGSVLISH
eukprot:43551-Amphidinium_carterae.1